MLHHRCNLEPPRNATKFFDQFDAGSAQNLRCVC
ncbi:Uncharacterised protein [Vibrio cholerae]|nr:Uncharacterised protein [Vibrio cholerae]